jgi:hypothetical protein
MLEMIDRKALGSDGEVPVAEAKRETEARERHDARASAA